MIDDDCLWSTDHDDDCFWLTDHDDDCFWLTDHNDDCFGAGLEDFIHEWMLEISLFLLFKHKNGNNSDLLQKIEKYEFQSNSVFPKVVISQYMPVGSLHTVLHQGTG